MKEIPLNNGLFAQVDDEDFVKLMQWNWNAHKEGSRSYARRLSNGVFRKTILMHRFIMNTPDGMDTDHIDGNGLNNQKSNLRICTRAENIANSRKSIDNTSGYKGVDWSKHAKKWRATIRVSNKQIHLGYFTTPEDAAKTYDIAAKKYFGEYSKTNFVE